MFILVVVFFNTFQCSDEIVHYCPCCLVNILIKYVSFNKYAFAICNNSKGWCGKISPFLTCEKKKIFFFLKIFDGMPLCTIKFAISPTKKILKTHTRAHTHSDSWCGIATSTHYINSHISKKYTLTKSCISICRPTQQQGWCHLNIEIILKIWQNKDQNEHYSQL